MTKRQEQKIENSIEQILAGKIRNNRSDAITWLIKHGVITSYNDDYSLNYDNRLTDIVRQNENYFRTKQVE